MVRIVVVVLGTALAASPAFAQAVPYEQSATCTIPAGVSQCGGPFKVPNAMVLTVSSVSAALEAGSDPVSVTLLANYANRSISIGLPSLVPNGSPYPGFSIPGTYFLQEGSKSEFLATRAGTSGDAVVVVTLTGYLNPRPGR